MQKEITYRKFLNLKKQASKARKEEYPLDHENWIDNKTWCVMQVEKISYNTIIFFDGGW